jgi:hypothetical protein
MNCRSGPDRKPSMVYLTAGAVFVVIGTKSVLANRRAVIILEGDLYERKISIEKGNYRSC